MICEAPLNIQRFHDTQQTMDRLSRFEDQMANSTILSRLGIEAEAVSHARRQVETSCNSGTVILAIIPAISTQLFVQVGKGNGKTGKYGLGENKGGKGKTGKMGQGKGKGGKGTGKMGQGKGERGKRKTGKSSQNSD